MKNIGLFIGLIVVFVIVLIILGLILIAKKSVKVHKNSLWFDRKRNILGLPWTFTVYELTDERLFITQGCLNITEIEVRLYRVMDVTYKATLLQRMLGMGTLILVTTDKTADTFEMRNIKNARDIRELITQYVEEQRDKKRVVSREIMIGSDDDDMCEMDTLI